MASVKVECPVHGIIGVPPGFIRGDGILVSSGNRMPCGICRRLSPVLDGTYVLRDSLGYTRYIPTPAERERLTKLLGWARKAASQPEPDLTKIIETVERQLEREAPDVAQRVKAFLASPVVMGAATIVGILLTLLIWMTSPQGISADDLERILESVVDHEQESQEPAPQVEPMPRVPLLQPGQDQTPSST